MTHLTIAKDHEQAVHELSRRKIPFREVILQTSEGTKKGIALSSNALILITAGRWLSDDLCHTQSLDPACAN